MGILRALESVEALSRISEEDAEGAVKSWEAYHSRLSSKFEFAEEFIHKGLSNSSSDVKKLSRVIATMLVSEEKDEDKIADLIRNLDAIEHKKRIRRVKRLYGALAYEKTQVEHVYSLLEELHKVLRSEIAVVKSMEKDGVTEVFIGRFKQELSVEREVAQQIAGIGDFTNRFRALIRGEHVAHRLDSRQHKLKKLLQRRMSSDKYGGIIFDWARAVTDSIEDEFRKQEAQGILENHPDVDFELVNRPEFVDLVKRIAREGRGKDVSDDMLSAFVHIYREWYNHERD
jgi:hypothetical protein